MNDPRPQTTSAWLSPHLTVKNVATSLIFYTQAFGFTRIENCGESDGDTILHAEMRYQAQTIMLGAEGAYDNPALAPHTSGNISPVSLYVYCHDVDALWQQALATGATAKVEPTDMFWGDRMCQLLDLDGHIWSFATHIKAT